MSVPGPILGPCESWIDGDDVAACCGSAELSSSDLFDTVAVEASMALYEISGRQFTGLCSNTVRPCRNACTCWDDGRLSSGPWSWAGDVWGGWAGTYGQWSFGWFNQSGDRCGCAPMSVVKLSGYPVREIVEVKIDGAVLDPLDANGKPNYRLDGWRNLVRMDSPGPPVVKRRWPACQNLSLSDDELGTFSITYRYGISPPPLGEQAAAELACQLFLSCNGASCQLPAGVTRIVRQGVEIDRKLLQNWFDPKKSTGLVSLDLFLRSYWGTRAGRRPAIWSPDIQEFARREGT